MNILVAVPCFNEESVIEKTLLKIKESTSKLDDCRILVIDDGSTDRSKAIAEKIPGLLVVMHPENQGLGATFRTAVNHALESGADILVTIDADGQFDSDEIEHLIRPLISNDFDMVTGSRFLHGSHVSDMPRIKKYGNKLYSRLISNIAKTSLSDVSCGFRAYSRTALYNMYLTGNFTYTHESIISLSQQGLRLSEVPIKVSYFTERESVISGNLFKYAASTIRIILKSFINYAPARAFFFLSVLTTANSVFFGAILIHHKLTTGQFDGFYFAVVLSTMFAICSLVLFTAATISLVTTNILKVQRKTLSILMRHIYKDIKVR